MKLLRHGPRGHEKPAAVDAQGRVRDLSHLIGDITPRHLSPESLAALRAVDLDSLPIVDAGRPGVPWTDIGKFIAIGLNYADHAAEAGMPIPKEPIVFMKTPDCAQGCLDPVVLPQGSVKSDWEVELGVVIGSKARYVDEAEALNHVAGYCVINDISEREYQLERGGQWDKGKGCDTFGPIGPWLVTADEIPDPQEPALADRQHADDDLRRRDARVVPEPFHDADARRRDHHRHAARGGHGGQAEPGVPEAGRRDDAGHRRARRATADRARLGSGPDRRLSSPRPPGCRQAGGAR